MGVRHGGRAKGTKNKKTEAVARDLYAICEEIGLDPFEGLMLIARDGEKEETRLNAMKEACKYLYSQKRSVDISTADESLKVVLENYVGGAK